MKTHHDPSARTGVSPTTAVTATVGKATLVQRHFAEVQRAPAAAPKEPGHAAGGESAPAAAPGAATDENAPAGEPGLKLHQVNQSLAATAERKRQEAQKKHGAHGEHGEHGAEGGGVQRKANAEAAQPTGELPRVQLRSSADIAPATVHAAAERGIASPSTAMPHGDRIQQAFGSDHDVSGISAHVGGEAQGACDDMGASAFAAGEHVAFAGAPDLHTAAHEAAHVVQQRGGVSLYGGVGQVGDPYEAQADAVADRVVAGESAADLLAGGPGGGGAVQRKPAIQRKVAPEGGGGTAPAHGPGPHSGPAAKKDRISIESKAWIPHAHVVDPEEPIRLSDWLDSINTLANTVMNVFDPGGWFGVPGTPRLKYDFKSRYRGDGHTGYAGSARAHHKVEFDWDGHTISGVSSTGRSEATHRDYSYHAWIQWGPFKKDVIKSSGTQTGPTAGGTTGTTSGTGVDLNIHAPNLLVLTVAPPIDAHYHGALSGSSLNLNWSTDNFPSHGYEVKKNGAAVHTSVVNNASWVPAEGPVGAAMIGAFLSLQTNDGSATVAI